MCDLCQPDPDDLAAQAQHAAARLRLIADIVTEYGVSRGETLREDGIHQTEFQIGELQTIADALKHDHTP